MYPDRRGNDPPWWLVTIRTVIMLIMVVLYVMFIIFMCGVLSWLMDAALGPVQSSITGWVALLTYLACRYGNWRRVRNEERKL